MTARPEVQQRWTEEEWAQLQADHEAQQLVGRWLEALEHYGVQPTDLVYWQQVAAMRQLMDRGPVRLLPTPAPRGGLVWWPESGMGYYPVPQLPEDDSVYDAGYMEKYRAYAATPLGRALNERRLALVDEYLPDGTVLDVGIGCGQFVYARSATAPTFGYDINRFAVNWLWERSLFRRPEEMDPAPDGLTFWDVLEHIPEPDAILARARWVFLSLPLFTGPEHVRGSKHYRQDEHCWYWTRDGLLKWMAARGFECREHNTMESLLGREDIHTFVFSRPGQLLELVP